MARINIKEIREHAVQMNDGWVEGAPSVEFSGIKQADYAAKLGAAMNAERELADILAQADLKRAEIEDLYIEVRDDSVRVANGVRGDKNYGPDSPLYGAMGFVRQSDRASGLTRKSKTPTA